MPPNSPQLRLPDRLIAPWLAPPDGGAASWRRPRSSSPWARRSPSGSGPGGPRPPSTSRGWRTPPSSTPPARSSPPASRSRPSTFPARSGGWATGRPRRRRGRPASSVARRPCGRSISGRATIARSTRPALPVRLLVDAGRIRQVITVAGEPLEEVQLEPETLTGLGGAANQLRHPVPLAVVPKHLVQAVLAAEDHRFFEHRGVDLRAVARAVWVNLRSGGLTQGGSTLTQQLVKNLVLTPKRTWGRKMREAAIALALERRYSKDEILSAYLNGIYLGQHGGFAVYGVGAASRSFFGKDIERLTLGEAATLAGIIRAPNTYSPVQHPERARERRNVVLRQMRDRQMLDDKRLAQASQERLVVQRGPVDQRPRAVLRGLGAGAGRADPAGRRVVVAAASGSTRRSIPSSSAPPRRRWRGASTASRASTAPSGGPTPARGSRARSWRSTPARARSARWSAGETTGRASSTASSRRGGSPARPSSRSSTWRRWARGRAASRPTSRRLVAPRGPAAHRRHRPQRLDPAELREPVRGDGHRAPGARAVAERRHGVDGRDGRLRGRRSRGARGRVHEPHGAGAGPRSRELRGDADRAGVGIRGARERRRPGPPHRAPRRGRP